MSDDTLNEVEVQEEVQQEIVEQPQEPEAIAEPAPASEEEHEQKSNGYEKRIHKLTAKKYEQLDEINRLKAEKEALEAKYNQASSVQTEQASTTVEMPNPDLQFEDPVKWQEQMVAYNQQVFKQQMESERIAQENARQQQAQQEQARQRQAEFSVKAEKLGVDPDKALESAAVLQSRGVNDQLAQMIVEHEAAPALMEYLASNPVAFEDLNNAGGLLATAEKLRAVESQAVTRNISSAPEPTPTLSGLSAPEPDDFDKACPGAEWV